MAMETEPQAIVSSAHHRSLPFFLFNTKPELEPTFSSAPRNAFFRSREREVEIDIVHYFFTETIMAGFEPGTFVLDVWCAINEPSHRSFKLELLASTYIVLTF